MLSTLTAPGAQALYDRQRVVASRFETGIQEAVTAAIAGIQGFNPRVDAKATLLGTSQGTVRVTASWSRKGVRVQAAMNVAIARNALAMEPRDIARAIVADAKPVEAGAPAAAAGVKTPYTVAATKLRAQRIGDLVVFTHPDLPEWSLRASVTTIKGSRADIEQGLAVSIQGFCAQNFERNAEIVGDVRIPVVASEAPKAAPVMPAVAEIGNGEVTAAQRDDLNAIAPRVGVVRAGTLADVETASQASAAYGNRSALMTVCGSRAREAALKFVRASADVKVKGSAAGMAATGNPVVERVDLSGLRVVAFGVQGSALVVVNFTGPRGGDQMSVDVPFDKQGNVLASEVGRTRADLAAAEDIRSKLAIASTEEAERMFKEFVEREKGREGRLEAMGFQANADSSPNTTWSKQGNMDRTPIRKASLPEEYSQEGKIILIGGMCYELQRTDYNAVSIDRSAHWMLAAKPEVPAKKADYSFSFGFGEAIQAGSFL